MLKFILLGFLNYSPMTGYDLKRWIDQSTTHFWHAYHSQIYTTLRKMESDGLVQSELDESDDKLERRVYTLTTAGQAELANWLGQTLMQLPASKDDLMVRLFFSGSRPTEEVLDELRIQRRLHQQLLESYQQFDDRLPKEAARALRPDDSLDRDALFWSFTLRHGMAYEEMYIRWLDETIAELERL